MIICKIGILNVQLVKSNLATRKHYGIKLSTRKKQLATLKIKFSIFNSLNSTCNSQNYFF